MQWFCTCVSHFQAVHNTSIFQQDIPYQILRVFWKQDRRSMYVLSFCLHCIAFLLRRKHSAKKNLFSVMISTHLSISVLFLRWRDMKATPWRHGRNKPLRLLTLEGMFSDESWYKNRTMVCTCDYYYNITCGTQGVQDMNSKIKMRS